MLFKYTNRPRIWVYTMKMIEILLAMGIAVVLLSLNGNALVSGSEYIDEGFINGGNSCANFSMENSTGFIMCGDGYLSVTDTGAGGDGAYEIHKLPNTTLADTN